MTLPKPLLVLFVSALTLLLSGCCTVKKSPRFTPWMDLPAFSTMLADYEQKTDGKNFWSRGHWINAVEGRWQAGKPEFRIKIGPTPANQRYWWYWWFNQSQEDFNKHIHRLSDQGFTLVQHNEFKWPDGTTRYNGVWQKTEPSGPRR